MDDCETCSGAGADTVDLLGFTVVPARLCVACYRKFRKYLTEQPEFHRLALINEEFDIHIDLKNKDAIPRLMAIAAERTDLVIKLSSMAHIWVQAHG